MHTVSLSAVHEWPYLQSANKCKKMHLKSDHTAPGTLPACTQASHANSEAAALEKKIAIIFCNILECIC